MCGVLFFSNLWLLSRFVPSAILIFRNGHVGFETLVTVAIVLWLIVVIFPAIALCKLHKQRIHTSERRLWLLSLLTLHRPAGKRSNCNHLSSVLEWATRFANGDTVQWTSVKRLQPQHIKYVRQVVEDGLQVTQNGDESITVVETSAWLLILSYLTLYAMLLLAADWSGLEVLLKDWSEDKTIPTQVGKTLFEWISNFVMLIYALTQLVTNGEFTQAFHGIRTGFLSSITQQQRRDLVALYIATTKHPISGLMQDRCYAPHPMNGTRWRAPAVNTALLASLGKRFFTYKRDGEYRLKWDLNSQMESFEVRTVGYCR